MKISYNWINKYLPFSLKPDEMSIILTECGLEVEGMEKTGVDKNRLTGVFVGTVKSCIKHPNADKLSLTKVDIGQPELLSIVCGAPNVAEGQKVLVATIGTKIQSPKGEFTIAQTKIRGEVSQGMICAEDELGIGESHAGILVLPENTVIGIPAADLFADENDVIFEIGLTPNRSDAASHIGAARDIIAVYNCRHKADYRLLMPDVSGFAIQNNNLNIELDIVNTEACPRYSGISISGIHVTDSPEWLQTILKNIGVRPINNIVDITNFVLFELGQPLHAFDADKIVNNKVVVKTLEENTKFITLDSVERILSAKDLMICNDAEPMCIAGVFGGEKSGITAETKNVFLESAYFLPAYIRKTSKFHGLKTDASFRFERGTDPEITVYALKRAALLILEIAGGEISSEIKDAYPDVIKPVEIDFSISRMNTVIGKQIDTETVKNILQSLDIKILNTQDDAMRLQIPTNKVDVTREIDVVEEVLRIYGYNNIEFGDGIRSILNYRAKPDPEKVQHTVSDYLTSLGFYEILTNSLTKASYYDIENFLNQKDRLVKILNPLSKELNVMRQTMLYHGLECIEYNINHKNYNTLFYDFGKVYFRNKTSQQEVTEKFSEHRKLAVYLSGSMNDGSWHLKEQETDFYYLKAIIERIVKRCGLPIKKLNYQQLDDFSVFSEGMKISINGKDLGYFGELSETMLKVFDIKESVFFAELDWDMMLQYAGTLAVQFKEVNRFPEVVRDLALLIDNRITFKEIEETAYKAEPNLLKKISLFDVYEGKNLEEGKKSYAVSFVLQDEEKTLTDEKIEECMNRLVVAFDQQLKAKLR
jgi:phenylalanyl-tRNA synthetase beta chain